MKEMPCSPVVIRCAEPLYRPTKPKRQSGRLTRRWSARRLAIGLVVVAVAGLALGLMACRRGDAVVPCPVPLEIVVTPASSTIAVGGPGTFTVRIPDPCNQRVLPLRFTWSLSDTSVASIVSGTDSTVNLIGKRAGHATVTATSAVVPYVKGAGLLTVIFAPPPEVVP